MDRRRFLGSAGALAFVIPGLATGEDRPARTRIGLLRQRLPTVNALCAESERAANLGRMYRLIAARQASRPRCELLIFGDLPLTGHRYDWRRDDLQRLAIEVPGEESLVLGRAARDHDCHVVFGALARDADWPGELLHITTILDANGEIAGRHWMRRSLRDQCGSALDSFNMNVSTMHNRRAAYVAMYGAEALYPVTRTAVGNIAVGGMHFEPQFERLVRARGARWLLGGVAGYRPVTPLPG
ncbi:MAG: hypothetical protein R3E77_15700 [Steroidobacteraceae bacterium]